MCQLESFHLNSNGLLNKYGENSIYVNSTEIIKFGVCGIENGILIFGGGFLSLYPGKGYGKLSITFLFSKLPKIHTICLESHDNILPFWIKCGGIVTEKTNEGYNIIEIYRK